MSDLAVLGGRPVFAGSWPAWPVVDECDIAHVVDVVRSGNWSRTGPEETRFRADFAAYVGCRFGQLVTNGTHALQLALEALDIGVGDEVIVPGLTWQACAACALDVNAVPVLVEIDPHTLCIDPAAVRRAITPRTRAIVVVHLYGAVADMDALLVISQETGIPIVEDCSHQHGAQWGDRKVGSLGAVGAFSFHQNKLLTSGEGGFVCTSDARLAHRLDALRNCGRDYFNPQKLPADYFPQSGNFRGTELQAAMLNCALPRLDAQNGQREASAARLGNLLSGIPGIMPQKRSPAVTRQSYYSFAFHYDAGQFAGLPRDLFMAALRAEISYPHIAPPYEPLTSSPLYKPLTKRRHRLSDEYWTAIDPARFDLPLCERAHAEWVTMLHYFLLAPSIQMQAVGDAIEKIRLQADRLARLKQRPPLGAA